MDGTLPPPRRTRKPRGQGPSRRGEILAAARRLFTDEGIARTTMRRIAADVGLSPTALYVYFADKETILKAIAEELFDDLLARLARSQDPKAAPLASFRAALEAYVAFGTAHPEEYRLIFAQPPPDIPDEKPAKEDIQSALRAFEVLEQSIVALQASGEFAAGDTTLIAETVWAACHGLTMLLLDGCDKVESPPERLTTAMIGLVINGLKNPISK